MSFVLAGRVFWTPMLNSSDKMVLFALCIHAWDDGTHCWPSQTRLASETGLTDRGIRNVLRRLEQEGFITVERKPNMEGKSSPTLYRIEIQKLSDKPATLERRAARPRKLKTVTPEPDSSEPRNDVPVTPERRSDESTMNLQGESTKTTTPPTPPKWGTVEALVELYNTKAPDHVPAVETISPKRRHLALKWLKLYPEQKWWQEVFEEYRRSRFLSGRSKPTAGHESFRPDFDWLLANGRNGVENAVKVHDGAYADA